MSASESEMVVADSEKEVSLNQSPKRLIQNAHINITPAYPWPSLSLEVRNLANTITEQTDVDPLQSGLGLRIQAVSDFIGYPIAGRVWLGTLSWKMP